MTYPHYPVGWAHAMDTPYQWTKQIASHWGGTRNGVILRWPTGIKAKGELRHQWCHVIDVVPTILEATKLPAPEFVDGIQQQPMEGTSLVYSFDEPPCCPAGPARETAVLHRRLLAIVQNDEVPASDDDPRCRPCSGADLSRHRRCARSLPQIQVCRGGVWAHLLQASVR